MADPKPPTFSTRLWSQECAIADARSGDPIKTKKEPGYEFSNGRRFDDAQGVYEQPQAPA